MRQSPAAAAGGKGKAKGKERAAQERGREHWAKEGVEGKHRGKPSVRAVEAGFSQVDDLPASKAKDEDGAAAEHIHGLAVYVPYCHQCRNKNYYEKMRCTIIKEDGESCGAVYCEQCIRTRCVSRHLCLSSSQAH